MADATNPRVDRAEGPIDTMEEKTAEELGTVLGDAEVHALGKAVRDLWEKMPMEKRLHAGALMIVFDDTGYYTTIRTPGVNPLAVLTLALKLELGRDLEGTLPGGVRAELDDAGMHAVSPDTRAKCDCVDCAAAEAEKKNVS